MNNFDSKSIAIKVEQLIRNNELDSARNLLSEYNDIFRTKVRLFLPLNILYRYDSLFN